MVPSSSKHHLQVVHNRHLLLLLLPVACSGFFDFGFFAATSESREGRSGAALAAPVSQLHKLIIGEVSTVQ